MPFAWYQNKAFVTVDNYLTSALIYVADGRNYIASKLAYSHFKEKYYQVYDFQKILRYVIHNISRQNPHLLQVK